MPECCHIRFGEIEHIDLTEWFRVHLVLFAQVREKETGRPIRPRCRLLRATPLTENLKADMLARALLQRDPCLTARPEKALAERESLRPYSAK